MAENQPDTAVQDQPAGAEAQPQYNIRVEDAGPATKKVFIEVPKDTVTAKIAEQYKELRQGAAIPGFRKGRAPQKLIEKKFSTDVKEQVRRTLISDSYEAAVEQNKLQVIGEPEFENPEQITLDEDQAMSFSFSIEVQPDIELPELKGIKVRKPRITITEDHISQAMQNLREQQGTIVPVEGRGVQARDTITADVHVKLEGSEVAHQHDTQIAVRPGRILGLDIRDFDEQLAGANAGETRTIVVKVPDTYPTEAIRGKDVQIEVTVKDIKKLEPVELNQAFLDSLGFSNEQELRDALREQMDERIRFDIQSAMRRQVTDHLMGSVNVQIPSKLSDRQAERVVNRRAVNMLMRGVPQERIAANIEQIRAGAGEEAARELKSFFILQKVAEKYDVDISEAELNGRIAMIALQQGRRPEKLRQELERDQATLTNLYVTIREEKALDKVLEEAEIEEVEPTAEQQKAVVEPQAEGESSAT